MAWIEKPKGRNTVCIVFRNHENKKRKLALGACSDRFANEMQLLVERLLVAMTVGELEPSDAVWIKKRPEIRKQLEQVGLIEAETPREPPRQAPSLADFIEDFLHAKRNRWKPSSMETKEASMRKLVELLPKGIRVDQVTRRLVGKLQTDLDNATWGGDETAKRYSHATKTKFLNNWKQVFNRAVVDEWIPSNPFDAIERTPGKMSKDKLFIQREWIEQLMPHLSPDWQVLVALARFGGLRCPTETFSLRWQDVDLCARRMLIRSPKTEHHEGKDVRLCPIFPELFPYLEDHRERTQDTCPEFVINLPNVTVRKMVGGKIHWKSTNLRRPLEHRLTKAGLEFWPAAWNAMRASRATEVAAAFGAFLESRWIGHSETIAQKHYLQARDEDYDKAITVETSHRAIRKPNQGTLDRGAKWGANGGQNGPRTENAPNHDTNKNKGKRRESLATVGALTDGEGFEPPVE